MKQKVKIDINTQFAVLGLSQFGRNVTKTLFENGHDVICCDIDEHLVAEATEYSSMAFEVDVTDESALDKMGLKNIDIVIIALDSSFEATALCAMSLKDYNLKYIIAQSSDKRQKKILESIGVDRIVLPDREIAEKVAYELITNNLVDFIHSADDYNIFEMAPKEEWVGKNLRELSLRKKEGINVIATIKEHKISAVMNPETLIEKDTSLVVLKVSE